MIDFYVVVGRLLISETTLALTCTDFLHNAWIQRKNVFKLYVSGLFCLKYALFYFILFPFCFSFFWNMRRMQQSFVCLCGLTMCHVIPSGMVYFNGMTQKSKIYSVVHSIIHTMPRGGFELWKGEQAVHQWPGVPDWLIIVWSPPNIHNRNDL